jgi:hypothetical protein
VWNWKNNVDRTEGHKPIPISSLTLLATLRRPHLAGLDDDEPIIRNLFSRARELDRARVLNSNISALLLVGRPAVERERVRVSLG